MVSEIRPVLDFKGEGHDDKVKGQIKALPTDTPNQYPNISTSYALQFQRHTADKIF